MTNRIARLSCAIALILTGGALEASQTSTAAAPATAQNEAAKPSKNMNEVLAYPAPKVLEAARQAMVTFGCDPNPKKDKPDYLECSRSRHVGAFVGSGGEKITIKLTPADTSTRVEVKTVKGFVGVVGMKNWSTPVFDEMVRILKAGASSSPAPGGGAR
jgi:hypothetical protein